MAEKKDLFKEECDEDYQKIAYSIRNCPRCGGVLKYNFFWAFRCITCDTEYTIYVTYDEETNKSFFKGKEEKEQKGDNVKYCNEDEVEIISEEGLPHGFPIGSRGKIEGQWDAICYIVNVNNHTQMVLDMDFKLIKRSGLNCIKRWR